ncbi:MAG: alpha-2-macroglobulin family protein, partial [Bacteroidota bacterium]
RLSAAYSALQINLGIGQEEELDSLKHIELTATNMSGQAQTAQGEITLQRLQEPPVFYINRYWEKPDVWTISESNFKKDFPFYAWKEDDDPEKWAKSGNPVTVAFDTKNGKTVNLNKNLQAGVYQLVLKSKDAYGEPVEVKRLFRIWESSKPATRFTSPNGLVEKNSYEPGETARIWLGGKDENLNVFFATEKEMLQNPRWLRVNGAEQVTLPITEANRGGMFAHWFVVRNNRRYSSDLSIPVPWSNKDLNITYESFRDKLAPGQQEEWRLKISGPKKDKVAAEMVATLYDASLDQFMMHQWTRVGYPGNTQQVFSNNVTGFNLQVGELRYEYTPEDNPVNERSYRNLNWFDFPMYGGRMQVMYDMAAPASVQLQGRAAGISVGAMKKSRVMSENESFEEAKIGDVNGTAISNSLALDSTRAKANAPAPPAIRSNLNETVFFMPEIRTDAEGNVVLKFKMNEALTRWKLITYAHTKDLKEAISVKEVVTQKDLMVQANAPRFLRAGDAFEFSAKVSNLSKEVIDGKASLTLLDAATLQPLDVQFGLDGAQKSVNFNVQPGQSAPLRWNIKIPGDFSGAVTWQVFADGKQFRDGEESTIPVVTNRMLVTETLPITVRGGQTKKFSFDNLKNANSNTLVTQRYTLEFTSNPAWYVVQSLPYLMEYPHECSEQIFSRFYANTLASSVTAKMPNIRRVYERWKGTDAMKSPLSKNQELKYALLEETPWVMEAQSEEQQRQNIALLFDLNRMADERERALGILAERQTSSGAWPWFSGGMESWYITQYIVEGLGHLQHLGAFDPQKDQKAEQMLDKALGFCDQAIEKQYNELEKLVQAGKAKWEDDHLDGMAIHYLYARSFFPLDKINKIHAYYLEQAQKYWLGKGLYQEGMIALALQRNGRKEAAVKIANSLRERAQQKEELGMYWAFDWGYYWYNLPIETQSLMVEVFDEVANDPKAVEELRIWLLKNKQTNRWESTKATAEAAYALLLHGENWLENTKQVSVSLGGRTIKPNEVEPGTGYFKQQWSGNDVKPSWSEITVANPNSNIVWGAAYWQYFEDLDKIGTFKKTPLTIVKQLFREENSPTGPVLKPITDHAGLKVGDKLKVRIEIRVDRPMEYVHLKDMRAAGFEPVNVISGYRYQGGLGYYESTKDLATNFFIDYLPRGTFVFEYPMFVSHRGDMSNGITTMQCMYAPEFTTHSEGIRVKVE